MHPFTDPTKIKQRMQQLHDASLLWAIVLMVLLVACCGVHYKTPPAARRQATAMMPDFGKLFKGVKELISNGNFMLLSIVFVLVQIVMNIVNCNLAALIYPYYYPAVSALLYSSRYRAPPLSSA